MNNEREQYRRVEKTRICGVSQECQCEECGWPLYTGDDALLVDYGNSIVCGTSCKNTYYAGGAE